MAVQKKIFYLDRISPFGIFYTCQEVFLFVIISIHGCISTQDIWGHSHIVIVDQCNFFVVSIYLLTVMLNNFHVFNTNHTKVSMQTFPNGGPLIQKAIFFCRTSSEGLPLRNRNTRARWVFLIIVIMVKYKYHTHHNYFKLEA